MLYLCGMEKIKYFEIETYLSKEVFELQDSYSGKPIAYFKTQTSRIPEDLFKENYDKMLYSNSMNAWIYLTRKVTREECIKLYGDITHEEYGPRGGWKSVTFGTTKFKHDFLRPQHETV